MWSWRFCSTVDRNSSLARRNSRMARPSRRPSSGSLSGPKMIRARTMMTRISWMPMSSMRLGRILHDGARPCTRLTSLGLHRAVEEDEDGEQEHVARGPHHPAAERLVVDGVPVSQELRCRGVGGIEDALGHPE